MKMFLLIGIAILLIMGVGWTKNLIKLTACDFEAPYKCEIMHGVGLFPLIGIFTGWMDFGK